MTDLTASRLGWRALWFSFTGRATRFDYWVRYTIPYLVGLFVATFLDDVIGTGNPPTGTGGIIAALFIVAMIWPALAVGVKRCHDRDRSGWFLLIGLIPFVNLWLAVELFFLRGTQGPNRFGPDPVGGAPAVAAQMTT